MEQLYEEERKARIAGELGRLSEIQHNIIYHCKTDAEVIEALKLLTNKRKQDTHCIKSLIKKLFEEKRSLDFYYALLKEVVESKIYLEEERLYIAEHIKLQHGNDTARAYAVVRDIPVETFTSVNEKRRNGFLFEQFRLALLLKCYEDAELISRRVRKSCMTDEEKAIFYNYCILLRISNKSYLDAARLYLELNAVDPCKKNVAMGSFYCMLSSCLVEGANVMEAKAALLREFGDNNMNDPVIRTFVNQFTSNVILSFSLAEAIEGSIQRISSLEDNESFEHFREELRRSIIEHNFLIVKQFVSKIGIQQLCAVLSLSEDDVVGFISEMVNEKFCDIKINQQDGLVDFGCKRWNSKVDGLLDNIVAVTNLIHQDSISGE